VATVPLPAVPAAGDEAAQVMLRFQDLMARFLDTQKSVMVGYLQGGAAPPPVPAAEAPRPSVPAPATPPSPPAPAAEANVASPSAEKKPAAADRAQVAAKLLELVGQRTGYPKEMLGMDLDLEADLGIDSIKRVEILGDLAEALGLAGSVSGNLEMEKLTTLKTLRGILDHLDGVLGSAKANGQAAPSGNGAVGAAARQLEVQRALVRLVDAPLPAAASVLLPRGTVLITDDGRGVAREVAGRLADFGQKVVLLRHGIDADLTDPGAVADLLRRVREEDGPLAGLVHLLPLAGPAAGETWGGRLRREVFSLYLLARGLEEDLRRAGAAGGAVLLAATGLGGSLGFGDALPDDYFPGHGGVAGFAKCLAFEWPEVLVRVVDLDGGRPAGELADRLLAELGDPDGPIEVGHAGSRRVTWEPYAAPLPPAANGEPLLGPDETVLVTGGARGITALVALELARRYRPNLVLVGRSPLPDETEAADTAGLTAAADVKAALIARGKREGRPVAAAAVEAAYQRLMQDREIRTNLARLRQTGARVQYHAADVRDPVALAAVLDDLEKRGGLAGVIHGAGVIEDRLVRDKTPESFDRVFGTKADSALLLAERLRPDRLKFCVFFASIASRYGNKGQADYAAANEVLSKLALGLDRRWPCRVVSVAWGPWSGTGMVADLARHLTQRGLRLITPEQGPALLVDELALGRKGDVEVIIAGGAEQAARPARGRGDKVTR
jgi:NAD(P)-dependent dehydrogenase (short-subunit alcohol dehydrogenase family)